MVEMSSLLALGWGAIGFTGIILSLVATVLTRGKKSMLITASVACGALTVGFLAWAALLGANLRGYK